MRKQCRSSLSRFVPCPAQPPLCVHLHDKSVSPRGGPWWARTSLFFQYLLHFKSARRTSCRLSWHGQPHANKGQHGRQTSAAGPASGCDALGPRSNSTGPNLGVHVCAGSTCITLLTMSSQRSYDSRHWIKCMFFPQPFTPAPIIFLAPSATATVSQGSPGPQTLELFQFKKMPKSWGRRHQGVSPFNQANCWI